MVSYQLDAVSGDTSFLALLDVLTETLAPDGVEPIAVVADGREGICGMCGLVINGLAHGPEARTTTCQLQMRSFNDGDVIEVEPWWAQPFTVVNDLVVDCSSFDRIIKAGGLINTPTWPEQEVK